MTVNQVQRDLRIQKNFKVGKLVEEPKPESCKDCALYTRAKAEFSAMKPVDIVFLMSCPTEMDTRNPFSSNTGVLVRSIVSNVKLKYSQATNTYAGQMPTDVFGYAVSCTPPGLKLKAEHMNKCRSRLMYKLGMIRPKLIVAFGADALKTLGVYSETGISRGNLYDFRADWGEGGNIKILPTLHPSSVIKHPGYAGIFAKDIEKALLYCASGFDTLPLDLRCPTDFSEVITELDAMKARLVAAAEAKGKPQPLALDLETTSLTPYVEEDRIIAVSLSDYTGIGLAFPYMHRDAGYAADQIVILRQKLVEVLDASGKVFGHNLKFDLQWMRAKMGIDISDMVCWDSLLCEHILDEDKKGEYSLKELAQDYFPGAGKYEAALKKELAKINMAREDQYKVDYKAWKERRVVALIGFWLALSEEERSKQVLRWNRKDIYNIDEASHLIYPKYKKLKGGEKGPITKSYITRCMTLFRRLPPEYMQELMACFTEFEPSEPKDATFEDVNMPMMLKYAAIDAALTRYIAMRQMDEFDRDNTIMDNVRKHCNLNPEWRNFKTTSDTLYGAMKKYTIPSMLSLSRMEYGGIKVDLDRCAVYHKVISDKIIETDDILKSISGKSDFNPDSNDLVDLLYGTGSGRLGLPVLTRTKSGAPSVDVDTLKSLSDIKYVEGCGRPNHLPLIEALLSYRKMTKARGTYLENWMKSEKYGGYIHCNFNQNGTATYRLSSSNPKQNWGCKIM